MASFPEAGPCGSISMVMFNTSVSHICVPNTGQTFQHVHSSTTATPSLSLSLSVCVSVCVCHARALSSRLSLFLFLSLSLVPQCVCICVCVCMRLQPRRVRGNKKERNEKKPRHAPKAVATTRVGYSEAKRTLRRQACSWMLVPPMTG